MSHSTAIVDVLRSRRSVAQARLSGGEGIDHDVVRDALESARWAPNHKRTEPWRFYRLDEERIERLAAMNAELLERRGSRPEKVASKRASWSAVPGVVIVTVRSDADADATMRREDYAAAACATQNFLLHLWAEGIASKWSTSAVWQHEGFWPLLGHDAAPGSGEEGGAAPASADPAPGEEVVGIVFYGIATEVPPGRRRLPLASVLRDFRDGA